MATRRRRRRSTTASQSQSAYLLGGRAIHFPFLSGTLRYNCTTCEAPCCRGAQLGIGRSRELVTLRSVLPKIPLFSTPGFAGSAMLSVFAPREACWFLDKKARCRLETVIGREAKPSGCRLFPFHRLRGIGQAVTVLPDFSCPITVTDEVDLEGLTSHDEICLELHRNKISPKGHPELARPRDLPWDRAARLERRVVELAQPFLTAAWYTDYAEAQDRLTRRALGEPAAEGNLFALDRDIRSFLDVSGKSPHEGVHPLVALTGVLRLMVSPLPRRELPAILVALDVMLDAYQKMRGARMSARTVVSMFEERLPLLYVLSQLRGRPRLPPTTDARRLLHGFPTIRAPLLGVVDDIAANAKRAHPKTLLELLQKQGDIFTAPLSFDAVAMLYGLGNVLLRAGVRAE